MVKLDSHEVCFIAREFTCALVFAAIIEDVLRRACRLIDVFVRG